MKNSPIFIIGWFRSGTTLAWNLFRHDKDYTCYYEPLHESLIAFVNGLYDTTDPTHLHVDSYWTEYKELPISCFEKHWKGWYGRERFLLTKNDTAEDLYEYISFLINNAPTTPVLKFVRACHRAEWLREKFPKATIIHVVRSPRDVWKSMTKGNIDIDSAYSPDNFVKYIYNISSELNIDPKGHPYQRFYRTWFSGYQNVNSVADETWWYEDITHPNNEKLAQIKKKYSMSFIPSQLISLQSTNNINDIWYLKQELAVTRNNITESFKLDSSLEKSYIKRINDLELDNLTKQIELARCYEKKYSPRKSLLLFIFYKAKKNSNKLLKYLEKTCHL